MARTAGAERLTWSRLGQQATPSATSANPATRPTATPSPDTSAPSSSLATTEGSIIKARPVAASRTANRASSRFMAVFLFHETQFGSTSGLLADQHTQAEPTPLPGLAGTPYLGCSSRTRI